MASTTAATGKITADREWLLQLWGRVLSGNSDLEPSDAVVAELAEFFGIPEELARDRCANSKALSHEEWLAGNRDTPDGLIDYWNASASVFGITMSHVKQLQGLHPPSSVELALGLAELAPGKMLDFGVGPGTNAMFFHELGWEVTLSDISAVFLDFARWRAERRHIAAKYLDTRTEALPADTFDLVMALEVMHVVPDVPAVLKQLRGSMRDGATLVCNVYAPPKGPDTYSYLYEASWPVLREVRRAGFERCPRIAHFYRFVRVERGPLATRAIIIADTCRYNRYVTMVGYRVRPVLQRLKDRRTGR